MGGHTSRFREKVQSGLIPDPDSWYWDSFYRLVSALFRGVIPGNPCIGPDCLSAGFALIITGQYSAVTAKVMDQGRVSGNGGWGGRKGG